MPYQSKAEREQNQKIIEKFQRKTGDTGSPEVQVALLTHRISSLTEHLKTHKKDFSSQRGLLAAVGQRRRALDYLRSEDVSRYQKLIQDLDLRK